MPAWIAAGAVFYYFIYKPEEERKETNRKMATVTIEKKHPVIGKHKRREGDESQSE